MYNVVIIADCYQDIICMEKYLHEINLPLNITNKYIKGDEAFKFISNNNVNIVISDFTLDGMSGLNIATETLKINPSCMFIMVSNSYEFSYQVARDFINVGVADYLIKPLKKELLHNSLSMVIEKLQLYGKYYDMLSTSYISEYYSSEMNIGESRAEEIYDFIKENHTEPITMSDITSEFYFSESYINKLLVEYKGKSFKKILNDVRIEHARQIMMRYPQMPINEVSELVGYNNANYFSRVYKVYTGLSPLYDRPIKIESIERE